MLSVIVGFYFLLNNKSKQLEDKQNIETTQTTVVNEEITPTISVDNNISDNLQTYTDKDYGFSIEYPSSWFLEHAKDSRIDFVSRFYISPNKNYTKGYFGSAIAVTVINSKDNPSDWYKNTVDLGPFVTPKPGSVYELKNLTINGYQTLYTKQMTNSYVQNTHVVSNGKGYLLYITFRQSAAHYSVNGDLDGYDDYSQYIPIYNQIVNSIKFF